MIVAVASAYAIVQLRRFRDLTESILRSITGFSIIEKIFADLLLAQSRAEQKFTVTRDETWYRQFVSLKIDFDGRLESASALRDAPATPILKKIQEDI